MPKSLKKLLTPDFVLGLIAGIVVVVIVVVVGSKVVFPSVETPQNSSNDTTETLPLTYF